MRVVKRATGSTSFDTFFQIASLSSNLASLAPVPAVAIAAATAIAILNVVAEVKANKSDCSRLAWRASKMLLELGKRMEGKWESAPMALIENVKEFEDTLFLIRDFMIKATEETWLKRLIAKNTFEEALHDFNARLDAAAQSFQIATLIEIHHSIGILSRQATTPKLIMAEPEPIVSMPEPEPDTKDSSCPPVSVDAKLEPSELSIAKALFNEKISRMDIQSDAKVSMALVNREEMEALPSYAAALDTSELDEFIAQLEGEKDKHGFRIYHQTDVRAGKVHRRATGWFSGSGDAQVDGKKVTIKRYGSGNDSTRKWMKDVKLLRQLFHTNIPQIVGYSDGKTAVPFILLANGPTKDVGMYVEKTLKNQTLSSCVHTLLNIYRDILSASMHVQQQLNLNDNQLQDFIEDATYTVDDNNNVLMGLSPPKEGWITVRSYNLCDSLVGRAIKYLKDLEHLEESATAGSIARSSVVGRTRQLRTLIEALLPQRTDTPELNPLLEDLLDEDLDDIQLSQFRQLALENSRHEHSWQERCPPDSLTTGDYGVILDGGKDFANFKVLGNVFDASRDDRCALESAKEVEGHQVRWVGGFTERENSTPYLLPGGLEGWPIALLPQTNVVVFATRRDRLTCVNDAWKYFIDNATQLAERHGIDAQSLILITGITNINDLTVKDWSSVPPHMVHRGMHNNSMPFHHNAGFNRNGPFNAPHHHHPFNQVMPVPKIVYLFTSGTHGFAPYITDDPMGRPRPQETRSTSWCYSLSSGWPVEYASYIQLDKEDFC